MDDIWKNFDLIVCICLESREDRYVVAKEMFDLYSIPVTFYRPKKHKNGGVQGCFESHINIITDCYNRGLNRVLIFEDDVLPTSRFNIDNMNNCVNFMNENKDWEMFFLGSIVKYGNEENGGSQVRSTEYENIYKSRCLTTHAYVVNRKCMEKYVNSKFISGSVDNLFSINHHNSYAFLPSIFVQRDSDSDIDPGIDWMKNQHTVNLFFSLNNYGNIYRPFNALQLLILLSVFGLYYTQYKKLFFVLIVFFMIVYNVMFKICYR